MIRQVHPSKQQLSELSNQRHLTIQTSKFDNVNDPFTYFETQQATLNNDERQGQFDNFLGVKDVETAVFKSHQNFEEDERVFDTLTIDDIFINAEHFVDIERTLNINTIQGDVKNDIELDLDKLFGEDKKTLAEYDDRYEEVPSVQPRLVGTKTIF